jgi:hypothetical protein
MFTLLLCGLSQAAYEAQFYEVALAQDLLDFLSISVFFAIPIGVFVFRLKNFMTGTFPAKLCTLSDDQVHSRTYARSELRA